MGVSAGTERCVTMRRSCRRRLSVWRGVRVGGGKQRVRVMPHTSRCGTARASASAQTRGRLNGCVPHSVVCTGRACHVAITQCRGTVRESSYRCKMPLQLRACSVFVGAFSSVGSEYEKQCAVRVQPVPQLLTSIVCAGKVSGKPSSGDRRPCRKQLACYGTGASHDTYVKSATPNTSALC
jgi:hypothetical protein